MMNRAPDNYVPRWALMYGIHINPMMDYCGRLRDSDQLPRGCAKRVSRLRDQIRQRIANRGLPHDPACSMAREAKQHV